MITQYKAAIGRRLNEERGNDREFIEEYMSLAVKAFNSQNFAGAPQPLYVELGAVGETDKSTFSAAFIFPETQTIYFGFRDEVLSVIDELGVKLGAYLT